MTHQKTCISKDPTHCLRILKVSRSILGGMNTQFPLLRVSIHSLTKPQVSFKAALSQSNRYFKKYKTKSVIFLATSNDKI